MTNRSGCVWYPLKELAQWANCSGPLDSLQPQRAPPVSQLETAKGPFWVEPTSEIVLSEIPRVEQNPGAAVRNITGSRKLRCVWLSRTPWVFPTLCLEWHLFMTPAKFPRGTVLQWAAHVASSSLAVNLKRQLQSLCILGIGCMCAWPVLSTHPLVEGSSTRPLQYELHSWQSLASAKGPT